VKIVGRSNEPAREQTVSDETLTQKPSGTQEQIKVLEQKIEEQSREIFVAQQELQTAYDYLSDVYKTIPSALIVFDTQGSIKAVNTAAEQLLGDDHQHLVGKLIGEVTEGNEIPAFSELRVYFEGNPIFQTEAKFRTSSGSLVPVFFSAGALGGDQGKFDGIVSVTVDLREQKRLEVDLRHAQKLEAVGQLAAGVAHEINTPIQFIGDSVSFIQDAFGDLQGTLSAYRAVSKCASKGPVPPETLEQAQQAEDDADLEFLDEEVPKAFQRTLDGVKQVARIVQAMKEFSHPSTREKAPADLNRALQSTLVVARNEYKYVADLETDWGDLPLLTCHVEDLNQVFLNLIVNAAHAIADLVGESGEKGLIQVRTWRDDCFAQVDITDTAGGIPDEIRDQVFDPFFTTKEVGRGTGQGLAIARSVVVDKHGGTLTFDSEPGQGTTFHIRLPVDSDSPGKG